MLDNKWAFDVCNWTFLTKDSANFLLAQAEKYLNETVDGSKSISEKTNKLLTLLIPSLVALNIYIFNTIVKGDCLLDFLPLSSILCLIILLRSFFFLFKNLSHYNVFVSGELPKNIATNQFIDNDFDEHEQYINYVINTLEHIQEKIDLNIKSNEIRSSYNGKAIKNILHLFFCPIIAFIITLLGCFNA